MMKRHAALYAAGAAVLSFAALGAAGVAGATTVAPRNTTGSVTAKIRFTPVKDSRLAYAFDGSQSVIKPPAGVTPPINKREKGSSGSQEEGAVAPVAPVDAPTYRWTFGDSTAATGAKVNHTFTCGRTEKRVRVELTVTATWGKVIAKDSARTWVRVASCRTASTGPAAKDDEFEVFKGVALTANVLGNDGVAAASDGTYAGGKTASTKNSRVRSSTRATLTVTVATPLFGAVKPAKAPVGTFTFSAPAGFCGVDRFVYHLQSSDPKVRPSQATVYLYVCADKATDFVSGLAAEIAGSPDPKKDEIAGLLQTAAKDPAQRVAKLTAAGKLVTDVLVKKGIEHALKRP
jgi:hypothetical protein